MPPSDPTFDTRDPDVPQTDDVPRTDGVPETDEDDGYIHGTTPEEQRRLQLMNRILNDACVEELGLARGARVLDVGSGLGQFSRRMARVVGPDGLVVGVERSSAQRREAARLAAADGEHDWVEWRPGEATDLPLEAAEWGTFDVVHTRFLLEHVRDPLAVVREMVAAARPGGRIVLADDDHDVLRLWPEPPGVADLWRAYYRSYDRLGVDPFIGRRLPGLLEAAGAVPTRSNWVFFGGCYGDDRFEPVTANLISVLDGARETILAHALFDSHYFDQALDAFRAWCHRPGAAVWYALCWAEGRRPDAAGPDAASEATTGASPDPEPHV